MNDRTHSLKIDKIMSEAKSNLYGVSQGSILDKILFSIFINDFPKINSLPDITTGTTIYADDVQLLFGGTPNNLEQLKIYAETSLKTMKEWYSENGLKMNSNKTQCILFTTPNFNKRTETFQITIDDTVRGMEDKVKNQGVIFDSRLSFEHHIKSLCSRLNGTISYLNRVKNTLDQKSRILLINALIFSHLNFCKKVKVKSSMARSLPVENLLPQNVGSIINYLQ